MVRYLKPQISHGEHLLHNCTYVEILIPYQFTRVIFLLVVVRVKLQGFLESSTRYDPACLLSEVVDTDMYRECSVLYGRVCRHVSIYYTLL